MAGRNPRPDQADWPQRLVFATSATASQTVIHTTRPAMVAWLTASRRSDGGISNALLASAQQVPFVFACLAGFESTRWQLVMDDSASAPYGVHGCY